MSIVKGKNKRIHFSGILGEGMLPLALLLKDMSCDVSGSDIDLSRADRALGHGISVAHPFAGRIKGAGLEVCTLALDDRDVEVMAARRLGVPAVTRAALLGALMQDYRERIDISGSHGKSTTAALTDAIFAAAGRDPTTICGARLPSGENYRAGRQDVMICEACEYRDAFLSLSPTVQVVTSLELDHTDYFSDLDAIFASFAECVRGASRAVVLNADCGNARRLAGHSSVPVYTYGRMQGASYRYEVLRTDRTGSHFSVFMPDGTALALSTSLIGEFNISNITASVAVADILGIPHGCTASAVSAFRGIERRLSYLCTVRGRRVLYDYAHHPTEIGHTLDAVRDAYGECTVVFRPHTFSRTQSLWDGFIESLSKADFTILTDIYPAREPPIEGVTSQVLAECMGDGAVCLPQEDIAEYILSATRGTVILMGAGDLSVLRDILTAMADPDHDGEA